MMMLLVSKLMRLMLKFQLKSVKIRTILLFSKTVLTFHSISLETMTRTIYKFLKENGLLIFLSQQGGLCFSKFYDES